MQRGLRMIPARDDKWARVPKRRFSPPVPWRKHGIRQAEVARRRRGQPCEVRSDAVRLAERLTEKPDSEPRDPNSERSEGPEVRKVLVKCHANG